MRVRREPTVVVREEESELRLRKETTKAGVEVCEVDLRVRRREVESTVPTGHGLREKGHGKARRMLLFWEELPEWQQRGSEHIRGGYRRACGSVIECLKSWTYLHNESVNIWSHLIGALIFLPLPYYMFTTALPPRYALATPEDILVCSAWFLGVSTCFVLSVAFHTLASHSESLHERTLRLDFQGVLVLMLGSTLSLTTYTTCHRTAVRRLAHHAVNFVLGMSASWATGSPALGEAHLGRWRAVLFALFGGGVFVVPVWWAWGEDVVGLGVWYTLGTAGFNTLGMGAYLVKFPEKWWPGRFDIFGASHQIMHVCVLIAAFSYSVAVFKMFDYRHGEGKCPAPL